MARQCLPVRRSRTGGLDVGELLDQVEAAAPIVDDVRAGLAERYLAGERYTVSDVSDLLGFAAPSAFSRWFRRQFGMSPSAWRRATSGR